MDYNTLLQKYNQLLEENESLKCENAKLRNLLSLKEENEYSDECFSDAAVTQHSSSDAKIALFRSLFCGREDVFARRWHSKSTDKSGYQPVCGNEWAGGLCDKRKYKCSVCPNRKLLPLTDGDIFKHLAGKDEYGRDVVGIYPMLKDETCNFLCVDFDEEDYKYSVTAFRSICKEYDIPVCVERSRSGNGAHIWILFSSPISAILARKLGSGLLTKAMESNANISFKSYDRLFPNQDIVPDGGFGNLIALPLQGKARKIGNSVFVDEDFLPYEDQWAYLSCLQKLSIDKAENLVSSLCKNGDLGTLVSDTDENPWETRKETILTTLDFPSKSTVVKANMLYVPTADLSPAAQNAIKRLVAFRNPDFYRAQAMRLPIYNKPRVICTAEITKEYIGLPRGCENALRKLLEDCNVEYSFDDKTNCGHAIPVTFNGVLREEQQPAADALLEYSTGVLSATTAFGKTVIASYLIGKRKVNTLILVHTQSLMQQWKKSLENFLDLGVDPLLTKKGKVKKNWSPIGVLGAGKNTLHGNVDVAVMQSLVNGDEIKALVRNYGMIIIDECHHVSAVNFEKILKFANAKYVYGLTATAVLDLCYEAVRSKPSLLGKRNFRGGMHENRLGKILHVHGTVHRDMVLGVNDISQIKDLTLFDGYDEEYINEMVKPKTNEINEENSDKKAFELLKSSDLIYIYGMSTGETDKLWWERICELMKQKPHLHLIIHKYDAPEDGLIRRAFRLFTNQERKAFTNYSVLDDAQRREIETRIHIDKTNIFVELKELVKNPTNQKQSEKVLTTVP